MDLGAIFTAFLYVGVAATLLAPLVLFVRRPKDPPAAPKGPPP
jgi:hypothetical protein